MAANLLEHALVDFMCNDSLNKFKDFSSMKFNFEGNWNSMLE